MFNTLAEIFLPFLQQFRCITLSALLYILSQYKDKSALVLGITDVLASISIGFKHSTVASVNRIGHAPKDATITPLGG